MNIKWIFKKVLIITILTSVLSFFAPMILLAEVEIPAKIDTTSSSEATAVNNLRKIVADWTGWLHFVYYKEGKVLYKYSPQPIVRGWSNPLQIGTATSANVAIAIYAPENATNSLHVVW